VEWLLAGKQYQSAIALPQLITAGRCFGNSFTLQRIRISCLPKRGVGDANTGGEI
jgi:hypothetical protein